MYSIVVPLYNSEKTVQKLLLEIEKAFANTSFEVILVNDCSTDSTHQVCANLGKHHSFIKYVSLAYNTGEYMAVLCGLHYAKGDYIAIIDDDLQNPPKEILKLQQHLITGYDVVFANYIERHQPVLRKLAAFLHNITASILLQKPYRLYLASFKLMNRHAVDYIIQNKNKSIFIDRLLLRSGLKLGSLQVNYNDSLRGYSNYTAGKLLKLYLNFYTNRYPLTTWKVKETINLS